MYCFLKIYWMRLPGFDFNGNSELRDLSTNHWNQGFQGRRTLSAQERMFSKKLISNCFHRALAEVIHCTHVTNTWKQIFQCLINKRKEVDEGGSNSSECTCDIMWIRRHEFNSVWWQKRKIPFSLSKDSKESVHTILEQLLENDFYFFIFFIIGYKVGMATRSAPLPSIRHLFKPQKLIF